MPDAAPGNMTRFDEIAPDFWDTCRDYLVQEP
jgi:hypothetical protein